MEAKKEKHILIKRSHVNNIDLLKNNSDSDEDEKTSRKILVLIPKEIKDYVDVIYY